MLNCEEFENNNDISIGKFSDIKYKDMYFAPILNKNTKQKLTLLTPELKQKNNIAITGEKRNIYLNIANDENLNSFLNKFISPLKNKISTLLNGKPIQMANYKYNFNIKFNEINLSIIDYYNNVTERKIISTSIDNNAKDINQYICFGSKIKFILSPSIWKRTDINNITTYGIILNCSDILIINGLNKKDNIVTKTKVYVNKKNNIDSVNNNIIDMNNLVSNKLDIQKHKARTQYDHNQTIINI